MEEKTSSATEIYKENQGEDKQAAHQWIACLCAATSRS